MIALFVYMKGMRDFMEKIDWNAPYIDRRTWILDHLQDLNVDAKEIVVLLLIDFFNSQHVSIDHELIGEKLKISTDEIEDIFTHLSEKGYLNLDFKNGMIIFDIEGVFDLKSNQSPMIEYSLCERIEEEFGRLLSSSEMQRILDMASEYDSRRVVCALNEAICNDVHDLNYIERILQNWQEKGLSIEDLENGKR